MTARTIATSVFALLVFTTAAGAHAKHDETGAAQRNSGHTEFTTQERQATNDWYAKNQAHPPAGFRAEDRLSTEQESRLKVGATLDPDLQKMTHTLPAGLKSQYAAPPAGYRYVAVGGHVALLDKQNQVHDVIHLHP
jgi:hypothetical protein